MTANLRMIYELEKVIIWSIVGVYTYANEDKYDGEWKDNQMDGKGKSLLNLKGIYSHANKSKYDGEWKEGKKHGNGK